MGGSSVLACNKRSGRKEHQIVRDIISLIGFMNGAADGQTAVFQSSFDMGYKQGFDFGLELSFKNTISLQHNGNPLNEQNELRDPRKINCHICINGIVPPEQNIVNLYNTQQEKNIEILKLEK